MAGIYKQGVTCKRCELESAEPLDIKMAFQPIVRLSDQSIFGYEALVRGANGEPAHEVLKTINQENQYLFDQSCRIAAIRTGTKVNLTGFLSINFLANAVYDPETCIMRTLQAAEQYGFPIERIMFEISEREQTRSHRHVCRILETYRTKGFKLAIDDFGAGHSGLSLLADFTPDYVKLDMSLVRGIDSSRSRQHIAAGMTSLCEQLETKIIAEGIETPAERSALQDNGIDLMQGFYFARPAVAALPDVSATSLQTAI